MIAPRVGTAGWSIPAAHRPAFPAEGPLLRRYGARLDAVEINSSFYRPHRASTYARWAASVPPDVRFAVKVPRSITHERRLVDCEALVAAFAGEIAGLGAACGPLLLQLPPSLRFDPGPITAVIAAIRAQAGAPLVCEPRHASWFGPAADALLARQGVARVAADPPPVPDAAEPGGWPGLVYYRWHGAPRTYYSDYGPEALAAIARRLDHHRAAGVPAWCIFDNTAMGHALGNALAVARTLRLCSLDPRPDGSGDLSEAGDCKGNGGS